MVNSTVSLWPLPSSIVHIAIPLNHPEIKLEDRPVRGVVEAFEPLFTTDQFTGMKPMCPTVLLYAEAYPSKDTLVEIFASKIISPVDQVIRI